VQLVHVPLLQRKWMGNTAAIKQCAHKECKDKVSNDKLVILQMIAKDVFTAIVPWWCHAF
jgi:hypothetical protein